MLRLLQVADQLARPVVTPDSLSAAGKWLPPAQLVQMLNKAELQSLADDTSRAVHDAVLGCCVITHLPPLRYDLSFHARLAQDAVNAMQVWRNAMLHSSAPVQSDDEVVPNAATRCRRFVGSVSDSQPEPALQHSGYASAGSEYMSCSSASVEASDIEIDLD